MPVTERTLWLLDQLRRTVGGHADNSVRTLTKSWVSAWDTIASEWAHAVDEVIDVAAQTGQWPQPWALNRIDRLNRATVLARRSLNTLQNEAAATIGDGITATVDATATAEPRIMASQLPARLARTAVARYAAKVTPSALEAIAVRCRQQVTQVLWPLSESAYETMLRALIVGVALGDNPRDTARTMLRRVEGAFNGGLARATNVARTEQLDAYRVTSAQVHEANADTLAGWRWSSALDRRTCPSCWAMHGTVHPLEQPGPWDHQSGRCARLPVLKGWAEIGIPDPEPEAFATVATERFAALDAADQAAIMGPTRLALLNAGHITFADLATRRDNAAWRPSYVPRPISDLNRIADRRTPTT